jgi:hypothetical protein
MTPEGEIKEKVRKLLRRYDCYYFQPVQTGFGAAGLDFHCMTCWNDQALAFFVETKKPGTDTLTERQKELKRELKTKWKANVFVINGDTGLWRLEQWLRALRNQSTLLNPRQFTIQTS